MPDSVKQAGFQTVEDLLIFDMQQPHLSKQIKWPAPPKKFADMTENEQALMGVQVIKYVPVTLPHGNSTPETSVPLQHIVEAEELTPTAFTCIVCKESFPDVKRLAVHLFKCSGADKDEDEATQQ